MWGFMIDKKEDTVKACNTFIDNESIDFWELVSKFVKKMNKDTSLGKVLIDDATTTKLSFNNSILTYELCEEIYDVFSHMLYLENALEKEKDYNRLLRMENTYFRNASEDMDYDETDKYLYKESNNNTNTNLLS